MLAATIYTAWTHLLVNGLTKLAYDNQPYSGGKILQSDNSVIDTEDFLLSGDIVVQAIATPAVVPTTPAGARKYSNFSPTALKIINQDNEIFDLIEALKSGMIKVQVTSPAGPITQGYLVFDVDSGGLVSRTLTGSDNITIDNGDGSVGDAVFDLADNPVITGTLYTNAIEAPNDDDLVITSYTDKAIRLETDTVYVNEDIQHNSEISINKISFTALSQRYYVGDEIQLDITNLGVKIGTIGARVTTIDNTGTNFATTVLMSGHAVQVAIANAIATGNSFRGGWDASSDLYPTTGGSGASGEILAGNYWVITVAGTLSGTDVNEGDIITALVDTPLQVAENWLIQQQKVESVFGRVGAITAQSGDYSFSQISGTCAGSQGGTGQTTTTANDLLVGGASNTWSKLAKVNSAVLKTDATGAVGWSSSMTNGQLLIGSTGASPVAGNVSAGSGISITEGAGTLQVTNTDKGSSVTLASAGVAVGTTSLVNDGVGAALAIKGVVGSGNILVTTDPTDTTIAFTGTLPVANGGTNTSSAIGANGTIAQSDGSKYTFTTATYPTTTTVNRILYSSSNDVVGQITSANSALLYTNSSGAPAFTSSLTNGQLLIGNTGNSPTVATLTEGAGITTTVGAGSITIAAFRSYGCIYLSTGTTTGNTMAMTSTFAEVRNLTGGSGWSICLPNNNFNQVSDGRMQYTGSSGVSVMIEATMNVYFDPGTAALSNYFLTVYKNGSAISANSGDIAVVRGTNIYGTLCVFVTDSNVQNGDYYSLFAKKNNSQDVVITYASLKIATLP